MKCLIAEDGFAARKLMLKYLSRYFDCDIAINGREAVNAVHRALESDDPYDLLCLDISMPEMDGQEALVQIRDLEKANDIQGLDGAKVIMTTAMNDCKNILNAFNCGCEAYLVKPVVRDCLYEELVKLGFELSDPIG